MKIINVDIEHLLNFTHSLCLEHYEEASFLFDMRCDLLENSHNFWTAPEACENRLNAHIDALSLTSECFTENYFKEENLDSGEHYAAMRVICSQARMDLIKELLMFHDLENDQVRLPFSLALCHGLPDHLLDECLIFLIKNKTIHAQIAADIISFGRPKISQELQMLITQAPSEVNSLFFRAFSRLGNTALSKAALSILENENPTLIYWATLYMLRIKNYQTISQCLTHSKFDARLLHLFGISCDLPGCLKLIAAVKQSPSPDAMVALGLSGYIGAVDILLSQIKKSDFCESCALALNLLLGADLYEEVFIPEEIDKDELFEEEIKKLEQGQSLFPEGKQPGETVRRICQQQKVWQTWWDENSFRFNPDIRYRNGEPFSLLCLVRNIESELTDLFIRQLAYEELVIRYQINFLFDPDMFVVQQKNQITLFREWLLKHPERFEDGKWYFAGKQH